MAVVQEYDPTQRSVHVGGTPNPSYTDLAWSVSDSQGTLRCTLRRRKLRRHTASIRYSVYGAFEADGGFFSGGAAHDNRTTCYEICVANLSRSPGEAAPDHPIVVNRDG